MSENPDDFYSRVGCEAAANVGYGSMPELHQGRGIVGGVLGGPAIKPVVSCWAQSDNVFYGVTKAHDRLPAAVYSCEFRESIGPVLVRKEIRTDSLIVLPDSTSTEVIDEIRLFRGRRRLFERLGFLHKRGILLWGPAGSGKTSTVMQLCDLIVAGEGGIAVYADHPELTSQCLQLYRIDPVR